MSSPRVDPARVVLGPCAFCAFCVLFASQSGCGSNGGSGTLGEVGTYDDGGESFAGRDATNPGDLDAHIEQNGLQIEIVTLSCAGACATVKAVATGGHPPYTFAWDDGSTNPSRQVCPTSSTNYRVTVTDTGATGEVARSPETAEVPLTARVLACPDGGPAPSGVLCVTNPSFEGTPASDLTGNFDAPPWSECGVAQGADVWNETLGGIKASQGSTYIRMGGSVMVSNGEIVSAPTCAPLTAGKSYSMTIDLAYEGSLFQDPGFLKLWGASAECGKDQVLAVSPIVGQTAWRTYCLTFTPSTNLSALTLEAVVDADASVPAGLTSGTIGTVLYADNIVPVASCP